MATGKNTLLYYYIYTIIILLVINLPSRFLTCLVQTETEVKFRLSIFLILQNSFQHFSYVYENNSRKDASVEFWRCCKAGKKSLDCKARITIFGNEVVNKGSHEHICKLLGDANEINLLEVSMKNLCICFGSFIL